MDKINVNDVIILRPLSFVQKYTKNMENSIKSIVNGHVMVKLCTRVAQYNFIPHAKKSKTCTDVIDNDVILLKFERFRRKVLNFKRLYLSNLSMKHGQNW